MQLELMKAESSTKNDVQIDQYEIKLTYCSQSVTSAVF